MKTKYLFGVMLMTIALASCSKVGYQVFEVNSSGLTQKNNLMVYENEDCTVSYNLWSENGSMGFVFENKTDKDIFLNMSQTFFIKNGQAYDYFQNRTYESRSYESVSVGYNFGVSKSYSYAAVGWDDVLYNLSKSYAVGKNVAAKAGLSSSVSVKESEFICVPANSYKVINGYRINPGYMKVCDKSLRNPKTEVTLESYSKDDTPLKFSNRIAYSFEKYNKSIKFINNDFWLTAIKNYSKKAATEKIKDTSRCKDEFDSYKTIFKIGAPNKFYVIYERAR